MTTTSRVLTKPSNLPKQGNSPLWEGHEVASTDAATAFSDWLEQELAKLEQRFAHLQTHGSVAKSLNR